MTVSDPFQTPTIPAREDLGEAAREPAAPEAEHVDLSPDAEAPLGYVIDRSTGERRPKKKAGRPPKPAGSRPQDNRPADKAKDPPPPKKEADMVPGQFKREEPRRRGRPPRPEPEPVAPFRAGPIAKGVNRLYRKAGKILSVWDAEIGRAVVECTRKDIDPDTGEPDAEDITVGEAWEEIARVNPRIRHLLLKLIEGGAWGQLFMAHSPILLAILMKESVIRRLPMGRLLAAFMNDSEDGDTWEEGGPAAAPSVADLMANLTQQDIARAMSMFNIPTPGGQWSGPVMNGRAPVVDDFAPEPDESGL